MVKKRPRNITDLFSPDSPSHSKLRPEYWSSRLFRNSFTYGGKQFRVRHWSVKIQHCGRRKTFSLAGSSRLDAAVKASQIYRTILTRGWRAVKTIGLGADLTNKPDLVSPPQGARTGSDPSYWLPRLIHRKYTEDLHSQANHELSVRIEHAGTGYYFPLRTHARKKAANQAVRIYKSVTIHGWPVSNENFPRELSIAFRWSDNPVAWTYTTIHTKPHATTLNASSHVSATSPESLPQQYHFRLRLAVAEPDQGVRQALADCLNRETGCRCTATFANAHSALQEIPRQMPHLVLIGDNLTNKKQQDFVDELKALAPKVACLFFSAYEDADQLFTSAPGGVSGYLFRRTPPDQLVAPLAQARDSGKLDRESIARSVRNYFAQSAAALPFTDSAGQLTNLTLREQEILALLAKGHPDKEIADLLRISTWTVHGHLKKIFEKLGAHNRTDAVVKFLHK